MFGFRHLSVKWKLAILIVLTSAFSLVLAGGTFFLYDTLNYKRAEIEELSLLADVISDIAADSLAERNRAKARLILQSVSVRERIRYIRLTDARGQHFAEYRQESESPDTEPEKNLLERLYPLEPFELSRRVERDGQVLGRLTLHCQLAYVHRRIPHYLQITGLIFALTMLSSLFLSVLLHRLVTRPIQAVTAAARSVTVGADYALDLPIDGHDEIGELVNSFNNMLAQIHLREEELKKHREHLEELVDQRAAVIKHTNDELRKEVWERKRAQGALIRLNEELEDRINERTQALLDNVLELRKVSEALERERNLFADGPVVVFKWRAEEGWPIEYVSSNVLSWGYESTELVEQQVSYESLVLEEDRALVFGRIEELSGSLFVEQDYRIVMRSGEMKWMYSYTKPVRNAIGDVTHYDGYLQDITERRTIQQALRESEVRLRLALDATNDVIWDMDLPTRSLYVSNKWVVLLDCEESASPRTFGEVLDLVYPADREALLSTMNEHLEGQTAACETRYRLRMASGEYKWILDRGRVVEWDGEGRAKRMVGTYTDITEQKTTEIQVSLQRALLLSMINSIPDLIYYKDMQGVYMGCNPAFSEYVGKQWDEVVGKTDADLFDSALAQTFSELDARMLESKQARIDESWIHYPDGRQVLLSTLRTPYYGPSGEVLGVVGISRDITAHRHAEQELAEKQAQLIHSGRLAALGEMSTAIAHELGQPLQIIRTSAGIIQDELQADSPDIAAIHGIVEKIAKQVRRAATIIRNVRAFARQDAEPPVATPIDLKYPLDDALSFFREQFRQHQVLLDVEYADGLPAVRVNAQKFQQIIVNLLSNARYAVERREEEGGEAYHKHVSVRLYKREESEGRRACVILEVADNGIGMTPEALERCMDPFYTTKPVGEGTGLGLSILYGIVKDFDGEVKCESEPGEGTLFRVLIPC